MQHIHVDKVVLRFEEGAAEGIIIDGFEEIVGQFSHAIRVARAVGPQRLVSRLLDAKSLTVYLEMEGFVERQKWTAFTYEDAAEVSRVGIFHPEPAYPGRYYERPVVVYVNDMAIIENAYFKIEESVHHG